MSSELNSISKLQNDVGQTSAMLHEQSEEAKEENNDTMEMNSMVAGSDMQLS